MKNENPMSKPEPWTMVSNGYTVSTKPMFEQYCIEALRLAKFEENSKVLDVACGPGTLSLLIYKEAHEVHSIDFSEGMLECLKQEILNQDIHNIKTYLMDGQSLEFRNEEFDFIFSIFGLMFFPDRIKGFKEIFRTLKIGGRACVTSWADVSMSPLMHLMFSAMNSAFPDMPESNTKILNLEDPTVFENEMKEAGFSNVKIVHYDGAWIVNNINEFFDDMINGSAPIVLLRSKIGEQVWLEKKDVMLKHLSDKLNKLPVTLHSRAYLGVGEK